MLRIRVSGSSETKTYGKGATRREHEELPTFPRRSLFGKAVDERARVFHALHALFSPTEGLFSGTLSGTALAGRWRASLQEPASLVKTPVCKCLKEHVFYATVGFDTAAAATPFWWNGTMAKQNISPSASARRKACRGARGSCPGHASPCAANPRTFRNGRSD